MEGAVNLQGIAFILGGLLVTWLAVDLWRAKGGGLLGLLNRSTRTCFGFEVYPHNRRFAKFEPFEAAIHAFVGVMMILAGLAILGVM